MLVEALHEKAVSCPLCLEGGGVWYQFYVVLLLKLPAVFHKAVGD